MTYLPRRPPGLRADQADAWQDRAADEYGGDDWPGANVPPGTDLQAELLAAVARARKDLDPES